MDTITTIGLDIAKSVFQVHGIDAAGNPVVRRQLKRRHVISFFGKLEPCLVGIEACASSHHNFEVSDDTKFDRVHRVEVITPNKISIVAGIFCRSSAVDAGIETLN